MDESLKALIFGVFIGLIAAPMLRSLATKSVSRYPPPEKTDPPDADSRREQQCPMCGEKF